MLRHFHCQQSKCAMVEIVGLEMYVLGWIVPEYCLIDIDLKGFGHLGMHLSDLV